MPLFYFVLKARRQSIVDPEGQELPDERAARGHAVAVAKEMMRNREHQTHHWRIEVCDDYMMPLFEVFFASIDESVTIYPPDIQASIRQAARMAAAFNDAFIQTRRTLLDVQDTLARADRILSAFPRGL